jgi:acetyl esterase/lipase
MSLAPECPFPAGIVDCLSVMDDILSLTSAPVNVGGISAGANFAAVVSMEIHRKYGPGKIKR